MGSATIIYTEEELAIRRIKSDSSVSPQIYKWLCGIAAEWGVHVTGVAYLNGQPYPTQSALFQMFDTKREREKLIVAGWETKCVQRASKEDLRAGSECVITLFDKGSFDDAIKKVAKENLNVDMVEKLKAAFTYRFRDEGWASIQTVKMPAMQNWDYIQHMSSTRSIDRTLRLIVRCPYTAASELPDGTPDGSVAIQQAAGSQGPAPQPPVDGGIVLSRPKRQEPPAESSASVTMPVLSTPVATPSEISPPISMSTEKKAEKINEKQIAALMGRWSEYVKRRMSGLKGPTIEAKLDRLVKALYGHTSRKEITVGQLAELMDFIERGEIEIADEEPSKEEPKKEEPKDEVAVSKPAIKL